MGRVFGTVLGNPSLAKDARVGHARLAKRAVQKTAAGYFCH